MSDNGTTHSEGCYTWGPKHYECALAELERLTAALQTISVSWEHGMSAAEMADYAEYALASPEPGDGE